LIRDIAITAFVYDFSDLIAEEYRQGTKRWNSDQRGWLRRRDKNRGAKPVKYARRFGAPRPSDYIGLSKVLRYTAGTLFRLIEAIPQVERDQLDIYPADFTGRTVRYRAPPKRYWPEGIRDYAEPAKLLLKSGEYESVWRQKAASPGYYILVPPKLAAFYLWLLRQLPTPEEQQHLKTCGRLYRNACGWWPSKQELALFDRCYASSYAEKSYTLSEHQKRQTSVSLSSPNEGAVGEIVQAVRTGGVVEHPGSPAKRYARLAQTMDAYNEQWPSYSNRGGLSRTLRQLRSLNIKDEMIEARDNMIRNLDNSFVVSDDTAEVA
jgi:hypothetical protein